MWSTESGWALGSGGDAALGVGETKPDRQAERIRDHPDHEEGGRRQQERRNYTSPRANDGQDTSILAFDGAGGHAGDEVIDEERVQHGDRDGAKKCSGHQLAPKELVAVD